MTAQIERALQAEVMLRIKAAALPVIAVPVPNSIYFPARNEAERKIIARVVAQMKATGQLEPGAFDIACFWANGGGGMIELKRPATRDLFRKRPAGRPSDEQIEMAERATSLGVNHAFCTSWDDVRARLTEWGAI